MSAPRAPLNRRRAAYHEAGHAVAAHICPLTGPTSRLTLHPDDLAASNAGRLEVNHALGLHMSRRVFDWTRGPGADREQRRQELLVLLAGDAAEFLACGPRSERSRKAELRLAREAAEQRDGRSDFERALELIFDAAGDPADELMREATPAQLEAWRDDPAAVSALLKAESAARLAELEALRREALALVASKWPHLQAVAEALYRRKRLTGDEVRELIERVEARLRDGPPAITPPVG